MVFVRIIVQAQVTMVIGFTVEPCSADEAKPLMNKMPTYFTNFVGDLGQFQAGEERPFRIGKEPPKNTMFLPRSVYTNLLQYLENTPAWHGQHVM